MPTSSATGGRESRCSSKSGASGAEAKKQSSEGKEKRKSSQSYSAAYNAARRGSVQPSQEGGLGSVPERPRLKTRTHSAPLVEVRKADGSAQDDGYEDGDAHAETDARDFAQDGGDKMVADAQDEDEVAGVVGAVRHYQPFQSPEVSESLPEINIAVIGAEGVGKTTFMQKALDLPSPPPSQAAERKIPLDSSIYLVRLLELPIDDVDVDDDDDISWPNSIEDKMMPKVDGAIALYDVKDKGSFDDVPEVLKAISKAALPSVLVSAKCDTPLKDRALDPTKIEQNARRSISGISTIQTTKGNQESHKQALSRLLRAILVGTPEDGVRSSSANRRRAHSNAVRPVSPRPPSGRSHVRASSEYTGSLHKDAKHARHDSSLAGYGSSTQLKVPKGVSEDDMHKSFLFEESASEEATSESARSSVDAEVAQQVLGGAPSTSAISENGAVFDELVDRLLAQPTSKADSKFSAIFLALYRKFAAPGRLLEAIAERFDILERNGSNTMIMTVTQLRYLTVLEQWIGQYPGDFAYPRTKRRMQTFIAKISRYRICTVATKEMNSHMDMVQDDDDKEWACSDKDREVNDRLSSASTSSTLIDDPAFSFDQPLSGSTLADDKSTTATTGGDTIRSGSGSSTTSSQIMANTEAAQKAAKLLQPLPRKHITKEEWRILMEQPDDLVAKEMTRMDWIMFSAIRPRDLVRQVSSAEKARCKSLINVNRMVEHFNHIAAVVSNYILLRDKPKHRALMLEKWMRIARKLRELNNYNALGAIIAGVKSSAVGRLAATRELIPPQVGKDWLRLEALMSSSQSHYAYRLAWENSNSERIPYLPLNLRDLASAEQGNATYLGDPKDERVNWKKFEIIGEVVVSMQKAQGMPYKGLGGAVGVQAIKELMLHVKLEKDEDVLFERSQSLEPSAGAAGASDKIKQFFKR